MVISPGSCRLLALFTTFTLASAPNLVGSDSVSQCQFVTAGEFQVSDRSGSSFSVAVVETNTVFEIAAEADEVDAWHDSQAEISQEMAGATTRRDKAMLYLTANEAKTGLPKVFRSEASVRLGSGQDLEITSMLFNPQSLLWRVRDVSSGAVVAVAYWKPTDEIATGAREGALDVSQGGNQQLHQPTGDGCFSALVRVGSDVTYLECYEDDSEVTTAIMTMWQSFASDAKARMGEFLEFMAAWFAESVEMRTGRESDCAFVNLAPSTIPATLEDGWEETHYIVDVSVSSTRNFSIGPHAIDSIAESWDAQSWEPIDPTAAFSDYLRGILGTP